MTGIHLSFIGPQVWECQQDTIKMIGSVRELSQGSRLASNELKQQFSRFRQNEIFLSNSPAETLCDSLEEYIESESFDDEEGSSLDESLLLRKFDELRYHILASGLLGGIREDWNVSTFDDETKERLTLEILSGGSGIQVAEGGLLYSSVFGNQVLVFPSQHDYKDTQDLLHALSEVYDATQKGEDWIIDMSCVMNFLESYSAHCFRIRLSCKMSAAQSCFFVGCQIIW